MSKADIKSMTLEQLGEELSALGQPGYRAKQIFRWLHRGVTSFDEMTDQPARLRQLLAQRYEIAAASIQKRLVSAVDGTVKYLYRFSDGATVEAVVMQYHHGDTICVSTQAGCRMGCAFCATGMGGLQRNLTASEILSQITAAQIDRNKRISNVVLMGMGEPLDNYDNVLRFLHLVSHPDGLGIGGRHISLSTCGLVDQIQRLSQEGLSLTLSVSLHAPNDAIRSRLMPVNRRWNIEALLAACRDYIQKTGRRVSFEYTVVEGVNDSPACAVELAERLRGMLCHVNLIAANPVEGSGCFGAGRAALERFRRILEEKGINATIRRTLGSDINASCGQLRRDTTQEIRQRGDSH